MRARAAVEAWCLAHPAQPYRPSQEAREAGEAWAAVQQSDEKSARMPDEESQWLPEDAEREAFLREGVKRMDEKQSKMYQGLLNKLDGALGRNIVETSQAPEITVINVEGKPVVCLIAAAIFSHDLLGAIRGLPECLPIAVVRDPSGLVVHDLWSLAEALAQFDETTWQALCRLRHTKDARENPFFDL